MTQNASVLMSRQGPVVRLTLNRPASRNALDATLVAALSTALIDAADDPAVRVVVLAGAGGSFSAGADIAAMRDLGAGDERAFERALMQLLRLLDELPKPTMALVDGPALGAGTGLVAACDVALASTGASFGIGGVRLGLVPAVVAPVLARAVGARQARRLMLTGERFAVQRAWQLGLVHEVAEPEALEARAGEVAAELMQGGPEALAETKRALQLTLAMPQGGSLLAEALVGFGTAARLSAEGQEGMAAFLERREPGWRAQARSQSAPSSTSLQPSSSKST